MKKSLLLAVATAGIAMLSAGAAMAHGDHRSCEKGVYGWHRHAGKFAQHRVVCDPPRMYNRYNHSNRCVTKCVGFGPFKECKTRCD